MLGRSLSLLISVSLLAGLVSTAGADPSVEDPPVASTFLGGSDVDLGRKLDVVSDGSVIVVGRTSSLDFPKGSKGANDVFVSRLSSDLSAVQWTFVTGGSSTDDPTAVRVAPDGIFVAGTTMSGDFPVGGSIVFDPTYGGTSEGFLFKLNLDGALQWSTYLGGAGDDAILDLDIDGTGRPVVAGRTGSCDFHTTDDAYRRPGSCSTMFWDAFVARFWSNGAMNRATLYGGSGIDSGVGLSVSPASGSVILVGHTDSSDLPLSAGALQPTPNDIFAAKLDESLRSLSYSTYLGGSGFDQALDVDRDDDGNAFITGGTASSDFPTTTGVAQPANARTTDCSPSPAPSPCVDGFVAKLNPTATGLVYSTYLGGTGHDTLAAIDIDSAGVAFVGGISNSPDAAGFDGLTASVSADGTSIGRSMLGGSARDEISGVRLSGGSMMATGTTHSSDFPTTAGAHDQTLSGFSDAFVTKHRTSAATPVVTFDHRTGNEWWVEVNIAGTGVTAAMARDTDGPWVDLSQKSWGAWAASFHIEPGHDVQFRAFAEGQWVESCWFSHPQGVSKCSSGGFAPTFNNVKGNAWWIETRVSSTVPVVSVTVSLNGGPEKPLDKTSWGWAKSYAAPQGTIVQFTATSEAGEQARSGCYRWTAADRASCDSRPMIIFDHRGGNEWWVEVATVGFEPMQVQAMDTDGTWTQLTKRSWGAWAASFHIEPGNDVRFRAEAGSGWHESCWFAHPGGAARPGGDTCAGTPQA